ncbi:YncE family protein [Streptomyces scabiei]|uniref:YncE family protein n=1 Tax=Streptomyces scabiei TaxID=1930 RepID=UPI001B332B84|nr:hypothetical protein [Streptomyces sp. LBUM 1487]MBP5888626.1 hypothetical protein [Streptomyces sp. LBUM 1487]
MHSALKRVFIGDDATDSIIAADYNGNRVDSVRGIDGVFDLALSDDGATLYAAARGSHEIVALDAATLDVKARYPVAASIGPLYLEFTSQKVWFTYEDPSDGYGNLARSTRRRPRPTEARRWHSDSSRTPVPRSTAAHGSTVTRPRPGLLALGATDFDDTARDMMLSSMSPALHRS